MSWKITLTGDDSLEHGAKAVLERVVHDRARQLTIDLARIEGLILNKAEVKTDSHDVEDLTRSVEV